MKLKSLLTALLIFALNGCNVPSDISTNQADSSAVVEEKRALAVAANPSGVRYKDNIFDTSQLIKKLETYSQVPFLQLTSYSPKAGIDTAKRRWVFCYFHGGGGDMSDETVIKHCKYFACKGYVALAVNYRNASPFTSYAQLQAVYDTWSLLQWIRANYVQGHVSPDIIFFMGASAGAITAYQSSIGSWSQADPYFVAWKTNPNNKNLPITVLATATLSGAAAGKFTGMIPNMKVPNAFYTGGQDKLVPASSQTANYINMKASRVPNMGLPIWNQIIFPNEGHTIGNFDSVSTHVTNQFYSLINR